MVFCILTNHIKTVMYILDAPIFVFIHGGYWQEFSKDLAGFSVPLFVKNKIKVITVGYDLCPNGKIVQNSIELLHRCFPTSLFISLHCIYNFIKSLKRLTIEKNWTRKFMKMLRNFTIYVRNSQLKSLSYY